MAPKKIRHPKGDVTVITHRYRARVVFLDELDASQRQRIRETFDALQAARQNWPDGFVAHGDATHLRASDQASLVYRKHYRYGIESNPGDYPTHCTVRLNFEPPLTGDSAAFAAAVQHDQIHFEYEPLQQAYEAGRFEFFGQPKSNLFSSSELHYVRLDFGVIGQAIDLGSHGGMAERGSTKKCNNRIAKLGRPFTFNIGWTIDRVRDVALDFAAESPRVRRRLQLLRNWSHETEQTLFPGSPSSRDPDGLRSSGRVRLAVGRNRLDRRQVRLHT